MLETKGEQRRKSIGLNAVILILLRPHIIILVSMMVSFLAWIFPSFGYLRKGLVGGYYDVSSDGILFAFLWIITLVGITYVGYTLGLRVVKPWQQARQRVPLNGYIPYIILSALGWAGVIYVLGDVVRSYGLLGVVEILRNSDGNALKAALYDNYSIGLPSLRYMTILSGALAIYHLLNRRYRLLNILNLIALACVAVISSRLAIVATIITALPLVASSGNILRIRGWQLAFGSVVIFLLLSALNWSRNGNFYREFGINNWLMAGFSEILAYVGSAFQGFLAAATLRDALVGKDYLTLPPYIKVSPELSTNSAFLQLITEGGTLWAFSFGALICILAAIGAAFAYQNRESFFYLLYGPLIYSFAELWRIYLFGQGIIKALVIISICLPLILTLLPKIGKLKLRLNSKSRSKYKRGLNISRS